MYDSENLRIVWKNVRKIRMREKPLEEWMSINDCDICAINETGLNADEYVEVGNLYQWVGSNRMVRRKIWRGLFIIKKYYT